MICTSRDSRAASHNRCSAAYLLPILSFCYLLNVAYSLSPIDPQNKVKVQTTYKLPTVPSPQTAAEAWLAYVWEKGGGLPIMVAHSKKETFDEIEKQRMGTLVKKRIILPAGMEEELSDVEFGKDQSITIKYAVRSGGLLSSEVIDGSHSGVVRFEAAPSIISYDDDGDEEEESNGTIMTWDVEFNTTTSDRQPLWQSVTNQTINDSCKNLCSYLTTPKIYRRVATFPVTQISGTNLTAQEAALRWIQFCWKDGAGLPFALPPIEEEGNARTIVPPFLKERLVSTEKKTNVYGDDVYEILYRVENPGLLTYPVHTHLGRIQFRQPGNDEEKPIEMVWEVQVRPYRMMSKFVQMFTSSIISAYSRAFRRHLQVGENSFVTYNVPGNDKSVFITKVRSDSWIGGALEARQQENQTSVFGMLQPWTWGPVVEDAEDDEESWTDGYLSTEIRRQGFGSLYSVIEKKLEEELANK